MVLRVILSVPYWHGFVPQYVAWRVPLSPKIGRVRARFAPIRDGGAIRPVPCPACADRA